METAKAQNLIAEACPELDSEILSYAASYFDDPNCDWSHDAIADFLFPLLDSTDKPIIDTLCNLLSQLNPKLSQSNNSTSVTNGPKVLDQPLNMLDNSSALLEFTALKVGDIRYATTNKALASRNTDTLDKFRIEENKEERISKRKAKKAAAASDIPKWNPEEKPSITVTQMKSSAGADSRSKDIKLENFDISLNGKVILVNSTLTLVYGRRYGLIGKNGIGKSTLLRAIASKELVLPSHIKVLHVEQEIHGDDTPALQSVLQADEERESLMKEEKALSSAISKAAPNSPDAGKISLRLKEIYAKLEEIEADKAESRASAILHGLGFTPQQQTAPTRTFSGGWRMRLTLARALFCRPDLLLADEVTNYLDFPAVVWLENYFQNWKGTLLVVSHDRSFLDAVSTDILHLNSMKLDYYRGNFTQFVGTRTDRRKNQMREYEAQLQYRQHLQAFIDRWRYNAKRSAQAQSKIKILEKLPPLEPPPKEELEGLGDGDSPGVYFRFPAPEKLSPPILQMDDVVFGYDSSRTILRQVSFDLQMESKIAIVGPNGAGKSTMIKLLTGQHEPVSGLCNRHGRLRIGLFSQHFVDQLDLALSGVEFLQSKYPGLTEEDYRKPLARYGLGGTTALQPIGTLSGGQKSRVVFAWIAMQNPHVLVLDEPTNHLDMDSIDALANALREFAGGVAIVSHDEQFLDAVCNEVWVCDGGKLTKFEGKAGVQIGVVKQYKRSLVGDD